MVTTGADKGKIGRVLRVITDKDKVVIEGINRVWKHVRPSQRNPQGGRIQKDAPVHLSNVMPLDPISGKGTRVRFQTAQGVKRRIAVRGGTDLGVGQGQCPAEAARCRRVERKVESSRGLLAASEM